MTAGPPSPTPPPAIGAWLVGPSRARFRVWAPGAAAVEVVVDGTPTPLARDPDGYWSGEHEGVGPGARYRYRVDGRGTYADPASMAQPDGVHGPSAVVDPDFPWTDAGFSPAPLRDWVLYELHTGTFSAAGTFEGVVPHLDDLASLGVNAVELMPIAEFPGRRNWGYDGVFPFAAHHAYGGLDGLRRLVDECHRRGLMVVLDVVYNHLGPEGSVLGHFGPYFTERYQTPWGAALNFDGPESDAVREFFVENARYWTRVAHVDGLRLDAVHAIVDSTSYPFVEELAAAVHACGRERGHDVAVIAESSANDSRLTSDLAEGGGGFDAQWSEDFHHALHAALTGEHHGYFVDYEGRDLAEAYERGFVLRGRYSRFYGRRHGRAVPPVRLDRLVVFAQNHDQVGNRARGDRLIEYAGFEASKTALACTLLAPSVPLIFMGEERAARTRFPYFVSHTDPELVEAVRRGRADELGGMAAGGPDPQDEATFRSAVLDRRAPGPDAEAMRALVRDLVGYRRSVRALATGVAPRATFDDATGTLVVRRGDGLDETVLAARFAPGAGADRPFLPSGRGWFVLCDTSHRDYQGPGAPEDPAAALPGPSARLLARHPVRSRSATGNASVSSPTGDAPPE